VSKEANVFRDRTVVVTGGSAGLGAALAEGLCRAGAAVVLVARDEDRLAARAEQLMAQVPGATVTFAAIDITDDAQVTNGFAELVGQAQRPVAGLFNAAGLSQRAAILDTDAAAFQRLWDLNFLGTVRCTRALATELLEARGHIVNIGSLASKVASPFLGAYPVSKFSVAAYSQQLRLELGPSGLHVLLVCPGPITREDGGRRYDDMAADLPESARRPGGGADLRTIAPHALVAKILTACERRLPELVLPRKVSFLAALAQLFPAWADRVILKKTGPRAKY